MFGRRRTKTPNKDESLGRDMSGSNGADSSDEALAQQTRVRTTAQSRDLRSGGRSPASMIGADLKVEGQLHSDGEIQIDGQVDGNIRSEMLVIGEHGQINGEVITNEVTVYGRVSGNIRSRKVHLMRTAHVVGDIFHNILAIETGAFFEGKSLHVDDPLSGDKSKKRSAAPRSVSTNGALPVGDIQ